MTIDAGQGHVCAESGSSLSTSRFFGVLRHHPPLQVHRRSLSMNLISLCRVARGGVTSDLRGVILFVTPLTANAQQGSIGVLICSRSISGHSIGRDCPDQQEIMCICLLAIYLPTYLNINHLSVYISVVCLSSICHLSISLRVVNWLLETVT